MSYKLGVIMDDIRHINVKKDSTLAMIVAALEQGWQVFHILQHDLSIADEKVQSRMEEIEQASFDPDSWCTLGPEQHAELASLDAVLMRKDPPFDMEFVYSTYLLERAEQEGLKVFNRPRSLRDCNEKLFATSFPQCCPPLLVSSNSNQLRAFIDKHQDVILKPLDGMGGDSIFRVKHGDANTSVIIETLTNHGARTIMGQLYLPEIAAGDKRILVINGEPIPYCLARVPSQGESRGNLAAGGQGVAQPLTDRDRWICEQVGPALVDKGIMLAGLDVIGDYLTEINVTSPTCLREIDAVYNVGIADRLIQAISNELS